MRYRAGNVVLARFRALFLFAHTPDRERGLPESLHARASKRARAAFAAGVRRRSCIVHDFLRDGVDPARLAHMALALLAEILGSADDDLRRGVRRRNLQIVLAPTTPAAWFPVVMAPRMLSLMLWLMIRGSMRSSGQDLSEKREPTTSVSDQSAKPIAQWTATQKMRLRRGAEVRAVDRRSSTDTSHADNIR